MSPARAALEAVRNGGKPKSAVSAAMSAPPKAETILAPATSSAAPAMLSTASMPPWEDEPPPPEWGAYESAGAVAQKKTESSAAGSSAAVIEDDPAVIEAAVQAVEPPPTNRAKPRASIPISSLNWDGNWPVLASSLPLRGVVQQLAQQSELLQCDDGTDGVQIHLRIPVDTLRTAGSVEKMAAALTEHFGKPVRVTTEIGAVEQTANAAAIAEREARQRQAEENMQRDPFVQAMMREFNAIIVPGSIKPI